MIIRTSLLASTLLMLWMPLCVPAQDNIDWVSDLETAQQIAARDNKLVLIHFWRDTCRPCRNVDMFVFTNPAVQEAISRDFVAVKIDTERQIEIAQQFGVRAVPHDVVITAAGQLVAKRASPSGSDGYRQMLSGIARSSQLTNPATQLAAEQIAASMEKFAPPGGGQFTPSGQSELIAEPLYQIPPAPTTNTSVAAATAEYNSAQVAQDLPAPIFARNNMIPSQADSSSTTSVRKTTLLQPLHEPASAAPIATAGDAVSKPNLDSLPAPVGLGGHCPVSWIADGLRQKGSSQIGCIHRGRLYWFASEAQKLTFMQAPDVFSPMLAGFDPVVYQKTGALTEGSLDYAVLQDAEGHSRLFLFANAENKAEFLNSPKIFVAEVLAAMRYADQPTIQR